MTHPRAGTLPLDSDLVDLAALERAYYTIQPDPQNAAQRVAFGTSGHRGTSFEGAKRGAPARHRRRRLATTAPRRGSTVRCSSASTRTRSRSPRSARRWRCWSREASTWCCPREPVHPHPRHFSHAILAANRAGTGQAHRRPGHHAFAQSPRLRRHQVRPAARRPRGRGRHRLDRGASQRAPRARRGRDSSHAVRACPLERAPARHHDRVHRRPCDDRRHGRHRPREKLRIAVDAFEVAPASTTGVASRSATGSTSPSSTPRSTRRSGSCRSTTTGRSAPTARRPT